MHTLFFSRTALLVPRHDIPGMLAYQRPQKPFFGDFGERDADVCFLLSMVSSLLVPVHMSDIILQDCRCRLCHAHD